MFSVGFSVGASANGFRDAMTAVTLTANTTADFQLARLPFAAFAFDGPLVFTRRATGGFDMKAVGTNTGDGCAGNVAGVTTLITTAATRETLTFPWNLPATRVIRPGERFEYPVGVMTDDQALRFQEGTYSTTVTFVAATCA